MDADIPSTNTAITSPWTDEQIFLDQLGVAFVIRCGCSDMLAPSCGGLEPIYQLVPRMLPIGQLVEHFQIAHPGELEFTLQNITERYGCRGMGI